MDSRLNKEPRNLRIRAFPLLNDLINDPFNFFLPTMQREVKISIVSRTGNERQLTPFVPATWRGDMMGVSLYTVDQFFPDRFPFRKKKRKLLDYFRNFRNQASFQMLNFCYSC